MDPFRPWGAWARLSVRTPFAPWEFPENRRAEFIDFLLVGFCCVRGFVAPTSSTPPTNQPVCLRIVDGLVKGKPSHIVFCFWTLRSQLTLSVIASGPRSFVIFPSWELHAGVQGRARDCHVHAQTRCLPGLKYPGRHVSRWGLLLVSCPFAVPLAVRVSATAPLWLPPGRVRSGHGHRRWVIFHAICLSAIQSNPKKEKPKKNIKQIK